MSTTIRLKHSSSLSGGVAKVPLPADLANGELALNINKDDPAVFLKDSAGNVIRMTGGKAGSIDVGATPPTDPKPGNLWWNEVDNTLYIYTVDVDGTEQWVISVPQGAVDYTRVVVKDDSAPQNLIGDLTLGPDGSPAKITLSEDTGNATFTGKVTTDSTVASDPGETVVTKDYLEGNTGGTGGEGFVEVAGDNMTGDLTLGTDKITLDATDGSAQFDGNVEVGDFDNTTGTKAFASGSLQVRRNDSNTAIVVYKDGTTTSDQTAVINADGSAVFAAGGFNVGLSGTFKYIESGLRFDEVDGIVGAQGFFLSGPGGNTRASVFRRNTSGSQPVINVGNSSDDTISLNANGSATFAGGIQSGGDANGGAEAGARLRERGLVQASADEDQAVWTGYTTGTSTATSTINGDGSADFAAAVQIGTDPRNGTNTGTRLGTTTGLTATGDTATQYVVSLYNKGVTGRTVGIQADGSAMFAGNVESGTAKLVSTGSVVVTRTDPGFDVTTGLNFGDASKKYSIASYDESNINDLRFYVESSGTAFFKGNVTSNGTIGFNLEPDNDANYTTTTEEYEETIQVPIVGGVGTADLVDGEPERFEEKTITRTREIKTYTGPTLDVKEELQKLIARAQQQDAYIKQLTAVVADLGGDVSTMPAPPAE